MKKFFLPLAIMLIVILVFTGCGKTATTTTPATATAPVTTTAPVATTAPATTTPAVNKYGGTLKEITTYSPAAIPGWPGDMTNPQVSMLNWICYEPLVKILADGTPAPWLATDFQWNADKTNITFTLRQNVKFHDGTAFTAASVKAQTDALIAEHEGNTSAWDHWEVLGDYSIRLYLTKYTTDFWDNITNADMFIISDAVLAQGVDYTKQHPCGTGPFTFKSYEKSVSMIFEKNTNYWQPGKPYLDGIELLTVNEENTQQAKMEAGEADVLLLKQGKILKELKDQGFNVYAAYSGTNFLIFDTANDGAVTNNPKVRMAIEYAINKQEMVDTMGYGYLVVNNQLIPPDNPGFNADLPSRNYDVAKAKALMAEAGVSNFSVTLISDENGGDIAVYLQQYLAQIGITLNLEMVDNAKYWNYCMTGWNGILNTGYGMWSNFPNVMKTFFPPASVLDKSCKVPDDILAKLDPALEAKDAATAKQLQNEIIKMVYDDCLFVPLFSNAMGTIMSTKVQDSGTLKYSSSQTWDPADTWKQK